jgi:rubrerythrin
MFTKKGVAMQTNTIDDYKDAIQLAIDREVETEQFYDAVAEKVHEPEAKSLLKRLAIEEKKHQKLLRHFSSEVTASPTEAFIPPVNYTGTIDIQKLKTVENIFIIAIQKEEESLNFYSRFLVYFLGSGHEKLFKEIFVMELSHKEQLERNMKNYLKK